ncbi:hypothetical protein [Candidatus Mycobacterium methanotrophicum]|uniref:Uncharacterized protein n=1 Tax=Candidatus Mycobacterium methanotrophicum TaxID=2943498 RepID=A0ABY4QF86_9MYCO|nr:hypothetical protein [Candidatus Mycobacterium methanotrophicum]UQX09642.1 hypothetical protein M5I08_14970 [Candidatus Mycobacterium methanotrophicum]
MSDMTVLVNLGYGGIADGWSQGPANADVLTALANGIPQGIHAAVADLENPAKYPNPGPAGQSDAGAAGGRGLHFGADRHLDADVVATHPGVARRQFPGFLRDVALVAGRAGR